MSASRPTWDETWMTVAQTIGRRSRCSRDQVGAVIVDTSNRIVDTGYNGPPRGMVIPTTDARCLGWCSRSSEPGVLAADYLDCCSLHAEQNALMFSDRRLREGGKIYVSSGVCGVCAKLIANSGLAEVIMLDRPESTHGHRRTDQWCEFLELCGLTVVTLSL